MDENTIWEPYEAKGNVSQAEYEQLAGDSDVTELTDEEAIELISEEFGFDRNKIVILHQVYTYERTIPNENRAYRVRTTGTVERKPLFSAWDWNYIRFDIHANVVWSYEMYNDTLIMYEG